MQYFGIKEEDAPAFALLDASINAKYLRQNVSPGDLTSFLADFEVSSFCV